MTTTPLTYTMADMLTVFQLKDMHALRRLLDGLSAHGFPPRLPHVSGQRAMWSKPAVDHWLQHWGQPQPSPTSVTSMVTHLRNQMEARHGAN